MPPLIVTLGTMALFRGVAEGITKAPGKLHRLPGGVPRARPGISLAAIVPAQLPILLAVPPRLRPAPAPDSVVGRAWYAIGFSAKPARATPACRLRAGRAVVPVVGVAPALPRSFMSAHLGQARSDAGTGYELDAITAVVLGGASVTGGRGTSGARFSGLPSSRC